MLKRIAIFIALVITTRISNGGEMQCKIKPQGIAIGNGQSPNDMYLVDNDGNWYNLGFYDNPWVKGYQGVISLSLTMGHNVYLWWKWPSDAPNAADFKSCEAMVSQKQYLMSVRSGR